jgi:ElaB/YqjD/DUF883 family membrane-anchored ribosome-binding protein
MRAGAHGALQRTDIPNGNSYLAHDARGTARALLTSHLAQLRNRFNFAGNRRSQMNKNGMTGNDTVAHSFDDKIDSLRDSMKSVVDQGSQKVDALKSKIIEVKDEAMSRGEDLLTRATGLIKQHPLKSIGIAFGVGFLAMRLIRR